jgi:hypothetical protein
VGRNRNTARQRLVRLPLELQPLIESGQRDPLIHRLDHYGMSEEKIAGIVGATIYHVRGVLTVGERRRSSK